MMLPSCNLKTKVLADVPMADARGVHYVLPCVYGISNFSLPPVGAAFQRQTDY